VRQLLIFLFCAVVSGAPPDVDWKNFTYPMVDSAVAREVRWMTTRAKQTVALIDGRYVVPDDCADDIHQCPLITWTSVSHGTLTGVKPAVAAVALTWHTGGTQNWQYVYVFALESSGPRLLAWLETGSRSTYGLRAVSIAGGELILVVNDPDHAQGDCCSSGSITTRYRWNGSSFSVVGQPLHQIDPPSFDCAKAATPVERLICRDADLSYMDSTMADSYRNAINGASDERKQILRRQQAEWFADYRRACNAPLSDELRFSCILQHLSDRMTTFLK